MREAMNLALKGATGLALATGLAACGNQAPTPSPGEGAAGLVNVQGAESDQDPANLAGGPSRQTPDTGAAQAPSQQIVGSPSSGGQGRN